MSPPPILAVMYTKHLQEKANVILAIDYETVTSFEEPYAAYIADLWKDFGIREAYNRRKEYHLLDSAN